MGEAHVLEAVETLQPIPRYIRFCMFAAGVIPPELENLDALIYLEIKETKLSGKSLRIGVTVFLDVHGPSGCFAILSNPLGTPL